MTPLELGFVVAVVALLGAAAYFAQMFVRELPAGKDRAQLPPTPKSTEAGDAGQQQLADTPRKDDDGAAVAASGEDPGPDAPPEPGPADSEAKPASPAPDDGAPDDVAADGQEATATAAPEPVTGPSPREPAKTGPAAPAGSSGSSLFAPPSLFDPPAGASGTKPIVPKVDVPKVDVPKVDVPKVDVPKADAPTAAAPKIEFPKVDEPVEMPVEKPKVDAGKLAKKPQEDEGSRYRRGLLKTRKGFISRLANLFRGTPKVDDDLKDDVEEVLFTADIGTKTAEKLLARVTEVLDRKDVADADAVWNVIRSSVLELIDRDAEPLDYDPEPKPYVVLMIGVNGVGKTTTIGKLAARHVEAGRRVLLVAGDTFRAAAVEQLAVWGTRVGCEVHTGAEGADPSSVIFDGIMRARKEAFDVVLCDTAGRLHTRKELMDELQKIRRSTVKALSKDRDEEIEPHDIFLVLDATIGQNALSQAQLFKETMDFSGLVLTKLDGTAKGGVVLGICDELRVPIRFIGIGEGVDDLRDFDAPTFAEALLTRPDAEAADA